MIPALPKVLASAVDTRTLPYREGDSTIKAVHVLKGVVTLEGADLTVRVIVKERVDGSYFYDQSVNKEDLGGNTEILDSADAAELSLPALLCPEPSAQQVLMDSVSPSGEIFNLFIEGEAREALAPEDGAAPFSAQCQVPASMGRCAPCGVPTPLRGLHGPAPSHACIAHQAALSWRY